MATRTRGGSKTQHRGKPHRKLPVAPPRLPGLNFDTFEHEGAEHHEGAYGTDRAPTYQSRSAATAPKRYVRKLLSWIRGRPKKSYKARRARAAGTQRRKLAAGAKKPRATVRKKARAKRSVKNLH